MPGGYKYEIDRWVLRSCLCVPQHQPNPPGGRGMANHFRMPDRRVDILPTSLTYRHPKICVFDYLYSLSVRATLKRGSNIFAKYSHFIHVKIRWCNRVKYMKKCRLWLMWAMKRLCMLCKEIELFQFWVTTCNCLYSFNGIFSSISAYQWEIT